MEYRITLTIAEHGNDPLAGERVLEGFQVVAPDSGPVVDQNRQTGHLSVTLTLDLADLGQDSMRRIVGTLMDGLNASGLRATEILDVELVDVGAGVELQRELATA
jgi:hypothetical protein